MRRRDGSIITNVDLPCFFPSSQYRAAADSSVVLLGREEMMSGGGLTSCVTKTNSSVAAKIAGQ
jgi:hypothetical protein